ALFPESRCEEVRNTRRLHKSQYTAKSGKERALNISFATRNRSNPFALSTIAYGRALCVFPVIVFCVFLSLSFAPAHAQESPLLVAAVVRGADAYSALQLLPTYQKYLGKPITNASIEAIAAAISKLYARDGFTAPEMQLDNSQLASGVLGIDVF